MLYLVPSLALVKQTIGEWLKLSEAPFPFLSVCSDIKTARKGDTDELVITQSDLPFAVTTQPDQINDWVKATENFDFRVVFATYDSAKAVAAGVGDEFCFDLGFFDEAHKTAGRAGTKYNFALFEPNIGIAKRLFMTATPRFVNARTKRQDGGLTTALSMDNAEIYGERYHNFSPSANHCLDCPWFMSSPDDNRFVYGHTDGGFFQAVENDFLRYVFSPTASQLI